MQQMLRLLVFISTRTSLLLLLLLIRYFIFSLFSKYLFQIAAIKDTPSEYNTADALQHNVQRNTHQGILFSHGVAAKGINGTFSLHILRKIFQFLDFKI